MLSFLAVTFQQHIRSTDSVSLRIDLLSEQMNSHFLATSLSKRQKSILSNSKHASGTAGSIVAGIGSVLDLVSNRHKHKVSHELDNITRCPVFSSFLVVFFIEFTDQLLKDGAHAMVIKAGMLEDRLCFILINRIRTQIDIRRCELLNNRTKNIRIHHRVDLVTELEFIQYHLNIWREAVKICFKVCLQSLRFRTAGQVLQKEGRRITESLSSCIAQRRPLVIDFCSIQLFLHRQHCRFRFFQQSIQTTNNRHRQNNVTILTAHINIAQAVVCDSPYKTYYLIMNLIVHYFHPPLTLIVYGHMQPT